MFKVSAVPPRRSAMLTVFRGATAINDGTTAEPLRPWRCNYGLCRTSTAVASRLRCDGGRRSAVMTILRDATAINDGTTAIMAVSLRNHGDNGGATAVYAVQAPQWYRASGVRGYNIRPATVVPDHRASPPGSKQRKGSYADETSKRFSREDIFAGRYFHERIFSREDIFAGRYFRGNIFSREQ